MQKLPLNGEYEVKLGQSFNNNSKSKFMTMRCDFLPASVDRSRSGSIKILENREIDVNLPNIAGSGPPSTSFHGNIRPVQKECILIFNKKTGELTLERIAQAALLRTTRDDQTHRQARLKITPSCGLGAKALADSDSDENRAEKAVSPGQLTISSEDSSPASGRDKMPSPAAPLQETISPHLQRAIMENDLLLSDSESD